MRHATASSRLFKQLLKAVSVIVLAKWQTHQVKQAVNETANSHVN